MVLDAARVLAEQVRVEQFLDGSLDRSGAPLDDGFAPADDSGVGLDAQEEPPWGHLKQFVIDYLHANLPVGAAVDRLVVASLLSCIP